MEKNFSYNSVTSEIVIISLNRLSLVGRSQHLNKCIQSKLGVMRRIGDIRICIHFDLI